jgi:hypothetical protein
MADPLDQLIWARAALFDTDEAKGGGGHPRRRANLWK